MKRIKLPALNLAAALALCLVLTACQGGGAQNPGQSAGAENTGSPAQSDPAGPSDPVEPAGPTVTANWTIEQAIENHMRFAIKSYDSYYADGTRLYTSGNTLSGFSYAELVGRGEASPTIREIQLTDYNDENEVILDADGNVWYLMKNIFPGYHITYFDSYFVTSAAYRQVIAAVTDGGKVVWNNISTPYEEPVMQEGLEGVKYVSAFWDIVAYVREDGTAGYFRTEQECHELEGWSDIAMVCIKGDKDKNWDIIGLKNDGTVVAQTVYGEESSYPEEILSWSGIVYLQWGPRYVSGMKADGSFVYALEAEAVGYEISKCEENLGVWKNAMAATYEGAVCADGSLLGYGRKLVYGWDLTQPWESREAALRDYEEDSQGKWTDRLADLG